MGRKAKGAAFQLRSGNNSPIRQITGIEGGVDTSKKTSYKLGYGAEISDFGAGTQASLQVKKPLWSTDRYVRGKKSFGISLQGGVSRDLTKSGTAGYTSTDFKHSLDLTQKGQTSRLFTQGEKDLMSSLQGKTLKSQTKATKANVGVTADFKLGKSSDAFLSGGVTGGLGFEHRGGHIKKDYSADIRKHTYWHDPHNLQDHSYMDVTSVSRGDSGPEYATSLGALHGTDVSNNPTLQTHGFENPNVAPYGEYAKTSGYLGGNIYKEVKSSTKVKPYLQAGLDVNLVTPGAYSKAYTGSPTTTFGATYGTKHAPDPGLTLGATYKRGRFGLSGKYNLKKKRANIGITYTFGGKKI